jgi:hypothetical protein
VTEPLVFGHVRVIGEPLVILGEKNRRVFESLRLIKQLKSSKFNWRKSSDLFPAVSIKYSILELPVRSIPLVLRSLHALLQPFSVAQLEQQRLYHAPSVFELIAVLVFEENAAFSPLGVKWADKAIGISLFFFHPCHLHDACAVCELPHRVDLTQTSERPGYRISLLLAAERKPSLESLIQTVNGGYRDQVPGVSGCARLASPSLLLEYPTVFSILCI